MDESKVEYARSKALRRIAAAVKPGDSRVTTESQQGEVEALLLIAASTFMAQHRIPYGRAIVTRLAEDALEAMARHLDAHESN
jgi:hypothetical protein